MTPLPLALAALSSLASVAPAVPDQFEVRADCARRAQCYSTVTAALAAADAVPAERVVTIRIGAGDFREKPVVRRPHVRLIGRGRDRTRLVFDAVAARAAGYDRAGWGTAGSATLTIAADDVVVRDLTVENDFDFLANDSLPTDSPNRLSASQAVAVTLNPESDRVVFDSVALLGYQDTFFTRGKRAVVRNSLIAGNVDFIFGNGMLLIADSEIRTRRRASNVVPPEGFASFVTAPSTPRAQPIGIVVLRSRLTREAGVADGTIALGRPWHPTTRFPDGRYADPDAVGQAVFIDCRMDAHIHPDGWTSMSGTARDGTKIPFQPQTGGRFAEIGSTGPGARRRDIGLTWRAVPTRADIQRTFDFAR